MQILRDLDALAWLLTSSYPKIGLVRKALKTLGILVLDHGPTHCHHERDRRVDLLIRPLLRWIQVARRSAFPTTLPRHHSSTGLPS